VKPRSVGLAAVACGLLTASLLAWVWGSLRSVAVIHDEAAYLLQARIFASGRWTAAGRPLPEFFEQICVLVTPVLASKYWPGHSLMLVPGIWLGVPGLIPLLFDAVSGAALYLLARRLSGTLVALLAWALWLVSPGVLRFLPSYLAQTTTSVLALLAWGALWRWLESGDRRWLTSLSGLVALGFITRPFTFLALSLPIAVVVLKRIRRRGSWRDLRMPIALAGLILALIPFWNVRTTGRWAGTPYLLYSKTYFPYDKPGFGMDPTPPLRRLPPDLARYDEMFKENHLGHTIPRLPRILWERSVAIAQSVWGDSYPAWIVFALIGLVSGGGVARFAAASTASLVLSYLIEAHHETWTAYYVEAFPLLAFLSATGLAKVFSRLEIALARRRSRRVWKPVRAAGLSVAILAIVVYAFPQAEVERLWKQSRGEDWARFATLLGRLPPDPAVVFVRYSPKHDIHHSLVMNVPDLEREHFWIAYDRGDDNARLLRLAPERRAFVYDEAGHRLIGLPRPAEKPSV
jgi:hypothetical protein